jgi:hypothetical protein
MTSHFTGSVWPWSGTFLHGTCFFYLGSSSLVYKVFRVLNAEAAEGQDAMAGFLGRLNASASVTPDQDSCKVFPQNNLEPFRRDFEGITVFLGGGISS